MDCLDESSVAQFVQGTLGRETRREVEQHLDACPACLGLVSDYARIFGEQLSDHPTLPGESARMSATPDGGFEELPSIERGATLGRYLVLERIGVGGMGVVYAAYDPELDRRVALKVMRDASTGTRGRARLQREAQAMARLSHPNVIAVHDVGALGQHIFIAMEFVDGGTLEGWLRSASRTPEEIIDAFCQAGEGLAAAHAVGLVHRDFKPANVLVGREGRFRVTDFGLARAESELSHEAEAEVSSHSARIEASLTATGAIVGTPAYMSPEQHEGRSADARSDQFAFCVALFEALYGRRPFPGKSYAELAASVVEGRLEPPGPSGPSRPWPILRQGLAIDPGDRFPDMRALLDALRRNPWRGVRRWLTVSLPLVALGTGLLAGRGSSEARPCQGADARVTQSWHPERAERLQQTLLDTGSPLAPSTAPLVRERIDAYTGAWSRMYVEACEATHVRGDQSADLMDRRMRCLDHRLTALDALLTELESVGSGSVERVTKAIDGLPPVEGCADIDALMAEVPLPEDPAVAAEVEEIERTLKMISAALSLGHEEQARARFDGLLERAEATGYAPTLARVLGLIVHAHEHRKTPEELEVLLRRAVATAIEGRDDRLAAILAADVAKLLLTLPKRTGEATRELDFAEAFVRRLGDDVSMEITILDTRSRIAEAEGRLDEGLALAEQALQKTRANYPPQHPRLSFAFDRLATLRLYSGQVKPAIEGFEQALAIMQANQGPLHPDIAAALNNLSVALQRDGRYEEAQDYLGRALSIRKTLHGEHAPETLASRHALAQLLMQQGELDAARDQLDDALEIARASFGDRHPEVAELLATHASQAYYRGDYESAESAAREALSIREASFGADHWRTAAVRFDLAEILEARGELADARQGYTDSLAVLEKFMGPDNYMVAYPLAGLARIDLAQKNPSGAIEHLSRAITLHEASPTDPRELARARFTIAQALTTTGNPTEALAQARQAKKDLEEATPLANPLRQQITTWLDHRRTSNEPLHDAAPRESD